MNVTDLTRKLKEFSQLTKKKKTPITYVCLDGDECAAIGSVGSVREMKAYVGALKEYKYKMSGIFSIYTNQLR